MNVPRKAFMTFISSSTLPPLCSAISCQIYYEHSANVSLGVESTCRPSLRPRSLALGRRPRGRTLFLLSSSAPRLEWATSRNILNNHGHCPGQHGLPWSTGKKISRLILLDPIWSQNPDLSISARRVSLVCGILQRIPFHLRNCPSQKMVNMYGELSDAIASL